ncbi:MAG: hypothetical protein ACRBCK_09955 [Alphaproteobacteria bacterium]
MTICNFTLWAMGFDGYSVDTMPQDKEQNSKGVPSHTQPPLDTDRGASLARLDNAQCVPITPYKQGLMRRIRKAMKRIITVLGV